VCVYLSRHKRYAGEQKALRRRRHHPSSSREWAAGVTAGMGMRATGVATKKGRTHGCGGLHAKVLWMLAAREQAGRLALLVPLMAGVEVGGGEEEEEEVAGLWQGQPCVAHTVGTPQVNPPRLVRGPQAAVVGSVRSRSRSQVFTQVFNARPEAHLRVFNTCMNVLKSRCCELSVAVQCAMASASDGAAVLLTSTAQAGHGTDESTSAVTASACADTPAAAAASATDGAGRGAHSASSATLRLRCSSGNWPRGDAKGRGRDTRVDPAFSMRLRPRKRHSMRLRPRANMRKGRG
jgi:hypothetical protein